ncbi:MAG: alpha/beta hydrolase [Roseovarius sp.]|nr:alpha/beta hydrolase [Roseovarius sp.]
MQIRREGDTAVTDDKPQDNVPPPPGGAPAPEKDLPGEDTRSHLAELSAKLIAMNAAAAGQAARATSAHWARTARALAGLWGGAANAALDMARADPLLLAAAWRDYATDARQRAALTADTLRAAATAADAHESAGLKPVLAFDYDIVLDGATLPRPVNYALVRIRPPEGVPPTRADLRPWVIIDPRSGQGSGIGGFKAESEVGNALAEGHPVYFVIFSQYPEPGQTLADVAAAEAEFLRRIRDLHPLTDKPFVTGNCQGGWATMILAATRPELTGPIVIAGVPLSPWAGRAGQNPLRYLGGWTGGALPAQMAADLGGGLFDGAALVSNFETMNPGRDLWRKHADLFGEIDTRAEDYLDFDRWWSGFYFMNAAEIRWIVENIFTGNRLARGLAVLDDGLPVDLREISAPIVVFASHGDAVSTVQQALRWIPDVWGSAARIREAGRTIIYTTHESATHLSIFVSAEVAGDHHRRIGSVLRTIEALPPGLYEMTVAEGGPDAAPVVSFAARETSAILALCDPPEMDAAFARASDLGDWLTRGYDLTLGPWMRALSSPASADLSRRLHPLRLQNRLASDANPVMSAVAEAAVRARSERRPVGPENPFFAFERRLTEIVERQLDLTQAAREALTELGFLGAYASPAWAPPEAPPVPAHRASAEAAADTAADMAVLARLDKGGFAEGVVRMCVLLSRAGGAVRQDRIERFSDMLQRHAPFSFMTPEARRHLIEEQSRIVDRAGPEAEATLPEILRDEVDRYRAVNTVMDVLEITPDSAPELRAAFRAFQSALRTRARNWRDAPSAPERSG